MEEQAGTVTGEESEPVQTEEVETQTPEEEAEASVQTDEDGGEESEETESDEDGAEEAEPEGEEEPGGRSQERIQQLANEKRELADKLAALEAKVNQSIEAKNEIPAIDEQALNAHLGQMREQIDDLRLEGNHLQADLLERQRNQLLDEYDQWKKKDSQRQQQGAQQQQQQQHRERAYAAVETAATLYQQENNIPEALFKEGGDWFRDELNKSPLLRQQFEEKMVLQGSVAAVDWAFKEKVKPHFDAKAKEAAEAKKKREAAKTKQVGGQAGGEKSGPKSYEQLMALGSAQVAAFKKKNPKRYQKLLDAAL